jgi:hypothetical protein
MSSVIPINGTIKGPVKECKGQRYNHNMAVDLYIGSRKLLTVDLYGKLNIGSFPTEDRRWLRTKQSPAIP